MANRLGRATSPYLLQHADNPVDWWEWGEDAFAEARGRDVPVLLSVGYAACHWCHVMAHESFEDEEVARVLNAAFVPVKVDREERPDVDAVYMAATTALTGQGGWPMTCLLTPEGEPFFAGTYFPRPQFLALLEGAGTAWREQRERVLDSSARIAEHLRAVSATGRGAGTGGAAADSVPLSEDDLAAAVTALRRSFDEPRGGFGGAPKFPPSMVLELLLRHAARTGSADALAMAHRTADAMARGGMYDQLGGGFARYSVDAGWVVPHFEKMLYDNAQLLRVYTHLHRATGDPLARRVAEETADFLMRDLATAEGGFASALDADTAVDGHSVEGATYVWSATQLAEVLGPQDGARAAGLLSVTDAGTFEHGTSTLQLRADPDDPGWWADVRAALLTARRHRPQPARDDKVVTAWNGLVLAGLADAGVLLGRADLLAAAERCATFLLDVHVVGGRLRRASRDGVVGAAAAVLDDHGDLAEGLLALHTATADPRWLTAAGSVLDTALRHFSDADGTLHDTPDDGEPLVARPRSVADNAEPCGTSALAAALVSYAALAGSGAHREAAESALAACRPVARSDPRFAGWALATAEAALAGPVQVAVVGTGPAAEALAAAARASTSPGAVVVHGAPDAPGVPLLEGRPLVGGEPAAYVCRGFVCDRPVTTVADLDSALSGG
ncbi:MAG TPA: thioredoxin domain-containing protein [Dermatophilaceae bacterium]|nr:thioredoxin domain-containing protein [Dermatophilaceae bacterium]